MSYKFKHLKVFGSVENLYQNIKKYRRVYDESECTYIYSELAFFNKYFDERDWRSHIKLVCKNAQTEEQICELAKDYEIKSDTNIFYVREGWGTPNPGWWKKGKYRWDAYIDNVFVGSTFFYVVNGGLVTPESNPYIAIEHVRLFESPIDGTPLGERRYMKTFGPSTRYVNIELQIDILSREDIIPIEFQFNYYNDAGQHKALTEYFYEITDGRTRLNFDSGYGSNSGGYWFEDQYTIEILFMDTLIGVVPFRVGPEDELQEGDNAPFIVKGRTADAEGAVTSTTGTGLTFEQASADLKDLIGLESVKKQIDELANYIKFLKVRKEKGFKEDSQFNLHTLFTGNPGTGKTTVARMLGKIYQSMGLLSKGDVHEVGRVDLVGEYIGQTAPKVQKAIDKARGGILFIDEAYSLSDRGDDGKDFGKEVLEVLIKEMSDGKGDIAMIFAGYPKEMEAFMTKNPGMRSRIQGVIHFPDYTPDELMQIGDYAAQRRDVHFEEEAYRLLNKKIIEAYRNRDGHFGNARYVHGVIEECKQNMALRLIRMGQDIQNLDKKQLSEITVEDVEKTFGMLNRKNVHIPVDEALYNEALAELHAMIGLDEVKRDVDEMAKLVRYYTEIGRDVKKAFSLHTVFTGNPGTGKTTVARILIKIYKALGILERGHLVEVDRKHLVAGFIGQTAIKTGEMIQKAMGGGLFIDEAYALSEGGDSGYGREAINTLLKMMEDHRGEFVVIVAGYPQEMQRFLESNPGLMSRFDRTLHYPDYDAPQLLLIAEEMFEAEGLVMEPEARQLLSAYIEEMLSHKHKYFGNARTIRKVVKEVVRRQNLRLANMPSAQRTSDMIRRIATDDLQDFKLIEQEDKRPGIGFRN